MFGLFINNNCLMVRTSSSNLLLYRRMLKGLSFIACKIVGEQGGGGGEGLGTHFAGELFSKF